MVPDAEEIAKISGDRWRLKYNRLYDRTFVCSKLNAICGCQIPYTPMRDGLKKCLCEFLESKNTLLPTSVKLEAWTDRLAGEKTDLSQFESIKSRGKYLIARYTPYFSIMQMRQ